MMTTKTLEFYRSLTTAAWTWIGRTAFLRGRAGVFQLDEYNDGHAERVAGLDGTYTADSGAQTRITFRFNDFITPTNPKANKNYRPQDGVHGWWCARELDWYIAQPESLKPFHDAINSWVAVWSK